jgi:hypothetical protein
VIFWNKCRTMRCNNAAAMRKRCARSTLRHGTPGALVRFTGDISSAGDCAMDQRDQELLDKQMRAINPAPRRDGVIIVTVLMVFFAGMTVGGILAESAKEPTRVAMNDSVALQPDGLPLTMRQ